jgi:hypothetical protein
VKADAVELQRVFFQRERSVRVGDLGFRVRDLEEALCGF